MAVLRFADRERAKAELVACATASSVSLCMFFIFALLGIISEAANTSLGLEPMSWFLLPIAFILAAIFFRIGNAICWYLDTAK